MALSDSHRGGPMVEKFRRNARAAARRAAPLVLFCALVTAAHADLQLCNRMSYVMEAAVGLEEKGAATTRGWFRLDPGQCRVVLQGELQVESYFLHARTLTIYGSAPLPQAGHAALCIGQDEFTITNARHCTQPSQRLARFTAVKPTAVEQGLSAGFGEEAEYTSEQARDAGIQRLLVIAGYDAAPIDGVRGSKTDAALIQFLQDNKLPATAAGRSDFFDVLIAAAQKPEGAGFAWCNETPYPVMAAIGMDDRGTLTTRGWYRVAPGACVRPELIGRPSRVYSFAEAVDGNGQALKSSDRRYAWGGDVVLCTRNTKFELFDQRDCKLKGLGAAGFAPIELDGGGTTVRFK
jgi:uncharacterized membrane protein